MKFKKGDTVIVTTGKDKGKKGKIDHVFPKALTVLVAGVNSKKRHMKKRDEKNPGGIIDLPTPIVLAKVALVCPSCNKQTRVGFLVAKGEKVRVCRKCHHKL